MNESLKTTELHDLVDRIQAGDRHAADALIRRSAERLEGLARKMLRDFPAIRRWEQTGDILQNSLTRLLRTLRNVTPDSVPGFFRLAARVVRRELLDMVRHYMGPRGAGSAPREPARRVVGTSAVSGRFHRGGSQSGALGGISRGGRTTAGSRPRIDRIGLL